MNFVRWPELRERLGGKNGPTRVTVWRWERRGLFPKSRKIGPNMSAWVGSEVEAWIEAKGAALVEK